MPLESLAPQDLALADERWQARVDLAACYRLVALYGWSDLIFTHISARVPGDSNHLLINPYGMMFEEVTASSLVKVDQHGPACHTGDRTCFDAALLPLHADG